MDSPQHNSGRLLSATPTSSGVYVVRHKLHIHDQLIGVHDARHQKRIGTYLTDYNPYLQKRLDPLGNIRQQL